MGHNARTCPGNARPDVTTTSEKKVAKDLMALLPPRVPKKVSKPLEGLAGCKNIWKEVRSPVSKKVSKPLEGLAGCKNIWKEVRAPVSKTVSKPLEGLAGCKNIWKEATIDRSNKGTTGCRICGEVGHNSRTCLVKCQPCADQVSRSYCFAGMSAQMAVHMAGVLECTGVYDEISV